jgi:hypothetical protein
MITLYSWDAYEIGDLFIHLITLAGLLFFFCKFRKLDRVVVLSFKDAIELFMFIVKFRCLEKPEETAARVLRMSIEDVKLEMERGRLMDLIGIRAMAILGRMETAVKGSTELIDQLEKQMDSER